MLKFFLSNPSVKNAPIRKYSRFDYLSRRYVSEINKVKEYYNNRDTAVENRNIFSRIISTIAPSIDLDIVSYFKIVDANYEYIARQFGLVSNMSNGKVLDNITYNGKSKEVFITVDTDIDLFDFKDVWKNYSPVKIVYTEDNDMDYYIFNKSKVVTEDTLSVFEVDVTGMCLMYREWCIERIRDDKSTHPTFFVHQYVLPGIMYSKFDLNMFTRLVEISKYGICKSFRINHPFPLIDYTRGIDNLLKEVLRDVYNSNHFLDQLLLHIPTFFDENMVKTLLIRLPYYTRQSEWVIWASRISYILNLLELLNTTGMTKNKELVNRLPVFIRQLENRSTNLVRQVSGNVLSKILKDIEKIKVITGRR